MSLDIFISADFWSAMVRVSAPIALAALACTIASRAGVLFIAVEGTMLLAAFFSIAGTAWTGSIALGVLIAALAGVVCALVFGVLSMTLRMGDVVAGLTVHVGALGLAPFLAAELFENGASIGSRSLRPIWPSFGGRVWDVLFHQQPLVYLAIGVAIGMTLFLRTRLGLRVRSSGESLRVAQTLGIDLVRLRFAVLAVSGALAGLAGSVLGLSAGSFDINVVSGQGFIGLACVMLGAWQPLGALLAAAVFATAYAVQFRLDAIGGWIQLFPYVLTLVAMGVAWGRVQGPPEEGRGLPDGVAQ
jgi:general nucleoside transport system permease protein